MSKSRPWFEIKAAAKSAVEIFLYGEIGWDVRAATFVKEFQESAKDAKALSIYINSPGGSVWDGQAIYNVIARHPARKTVHIDAIALSMGSVIAMVGDDVIMPENALMMIHDPSWIAMGTSEDMRKQADVLDKTKSTLVAIYAKKTGKSADEISELMNDETWFTAEEAVANGFADAITDAVDLAACADFDLSKFAKKVPTTLATAMHRRPAASGPSLDLLYNEVRHAQAR